MDPWDRPKVLLLGDSITQQAFSVEHAGFGAGLSDWFRRSADVVNRGFSGYNTRWARWMLSRLLPPSKTSNLLLCTVFFGANDSVSEGETQHVPVAEYKENLVRIVVHLREITPSTVILLVTPPMVDSSQWPTRSPDKAAQYAEAVREIYSDELARGERIGILDLKHLTLADLRDGLHLNQSGNAKVLETIKHEIRSSFPELCPDDDENGNPSLEFQYPLSSTFASKSLEQLEAELSSWSWASR